MPFKTFLIDLIVYDFDGVMTDNRVLVLQDGTEAVIVNRGDGLGVDRLRKAGFPQLIISTEENPVVQARGEKLQLEVIQGCGNKKSTLIKLCETRGYKLERVIYVGNDVNDLEAMECVGLAVAPADAHYKVQSIAKVITRAAGGAGVIRELSDRILDNP